MAARQHERQRDERCDDRQSRLIDDRARVAAVW